MNQINTQVIRENFYIVVSKAKFYLGNAVEIAKANPNTVIAAVATLATAILVGAAVKCYKNYTGLKNQVKILEADNKNLLDARNLATNNLNRVAQDVVTLKDEVKSLTGQLEVKTEQFNESNAKFISKNNELESLLSKLPAQYLS